MDSDRAHGLLVTVMRIPIDIAPGLVTQDTSFRNQGRWEDASNVRFRDGQWEVIGGWESLVTTLLTGVCRTIFQWTDNSSALNIAFGTNEKLQLWLGGVLYDITPAGFVAGAVDGTGGAGYGTGAYGIGEYSEPSTADFFPLTWSFAPYGETLMANPRGQTIYTWENNTANPATALTNAPAEVTYMLVVPQRQVMALGCNEETSGVFNPLCIRWSDIEDPEQWATATNNNAGEYILEGGSRIVCGRVVGDYVFIWTDVALYMGTFIGDPGETWRFEKLGNHCGAIGPNAPVVYSQQAFWIAPDTQFWTCQLGGAPQSIDCPVWREFSDNIAVGQSDKIVGATISKFREVRWFYPDQRDGYENSRDITLNLAGPWCHGKLPRTAFVDAGPSDSPIGVTPGGNIYWHERGNSADGAAFSWFIRSSDFYIGEGDKMLMIRGIWPDFKGQIGPMNFEITTRKYPQAAARLNGPYTLAPNQSKKDFRATGRVANVRFYGSSAPTYARMGKPEFDATDVGEN